jgi:hypothetical protein
VTRRGCMPCRSPSCSSPSTPFAVLTQSCDFHRYPDANSIPGFASRFSRNWVQFTARQVKNRLQSTAPGVYRHRSCAFLIVP